MSLKIANHPCFNEASRHSFGRIHLPVAPKCNIQCNYCNSKFDCMNENRPGVTSRILSPEQAMHYLDQAMQLSPNIAVVGIAGPGDPFANPEESMQTLRLVRAKYPDMLLCVATNGLDLLPCINELAALQVTHVTITINAIDPEIGAKIYSWARYNKKMYRDIDAAELLITNQLEALKKLREAGITAKVNSIIIPGINDTQVIEVARRVAELGADILNCMPYYNTKESVFENIAEPSAAVVAEIQHAAGKYLPQMMHCSRCRADAVGIIGEVNSDEMMQNLADAAALPKNPGDKRPYIAVGSLDGFMINQHLGEAERFLIYGMASIGRGYVLVDSREAPPAGGGEERWHRLAAQLIDCRSVLVSGAGSSPIKALNAHGIDVLVLDGTIESAVYTGFGREEISEGMKINPLNACGPGCSGAKGGCT